MKLKKLLKLVPLKIYRGGKDVEITGLCAHSKLTSPGNLFIAKKGLKTDGAKFIEEAIQSGAAAILSETGNPFLRNITQLTHPDIGAIEGKLASAYYGYPSSKLFTVGITGTNGKTTSTYMIKHLLDAVGKSAGLIGTIEQIIGNYRYPSERTTQDVLTNHKLLKEMVQKGCQSVVMEVTSHGLMQGRVDEIQFQVAIFTNLTRDHLDYHQTMDDYAAAKKRLFARLSASSWAIVNKDDPYSSFMIEGCAANILTFGIENKADLQAINVQLSQEGTSFDLLYKGKITPIRLPLIGRFNVLNALSAIGTMLIASVPLDLIIHHLEAFKAVPGRLERVSGRAVFVDYAHSPDALENVLKTLHEIKKSKIITVFGCGGDRDKGKRPLMAKVVEKYADIAIVTSDNPRSENPHAIIEEILQGFEGKKYLIEVDRKEAIEKAIQLGKSEDLILIAGKGHETYQIFSHQTVPFDDRLVAAECIEREWNR